MQYNGKINSMTLDFTSFLAKGTLVPLPSTLPHSFPIIVYCHHFFCQPHSGHTSYITPSANSNSLLCSNCGCAEIGGKRSLIMCVDLICGQNPGWPHFLAPLLYLWARSASWIHFKTELLTLEEMGTGLWGLGWKTT